MEFRESTTLASAHNYGRWRFSTGSADVRCRTWDVECSASRTSNIERPTSNIDPRGPNTLTRTCLPRQPADAVHRQDERFFPRRLVAVLHDVGVFGRVVVERAEHRDSAEAGLAKE